MISLLSMTVTTAFGRGTPDSSSSRFSVLSSQRGADLRYLPGDDGSVRASGGPFQNDDQKGALEDPLNHETGFLLLRLTEKSVEERIAPASEQAGEGMGKLELEVSHRREGIPLLVHEEGGAGAQKTPQRSKTVADGREPSGMGDDLVGKRHVV